MGPAAAHHLLHGRAAGGLPRPGARARQRLPHPHRAAADRRARRGRAPRRRRPLRPRVLLLDLAHRALARSTSRSPRTSSLSLNPSQISGGCGRLLCCLKYEHEFYVARAQALPPGGQDRSTTLRGAEKVVAVDIFRERVYLRGAGRGAHHRRSSSCARRWTGAAGGAVVTLHRRSGLSAPSRAAARSGPSAADRAARSGAGPERATRRDRGASAHRSREPSPGGSAVAGAGRRPPRRRRSGGASPPARAAAAPPARTRTRRAPRQLSDVVLHHHRHRLRQRRSAPRARLREDRRRLHRALSPPAAATTSGSSSAWTSTARRWRRPPPPSGVTPQAFVDRIAGRFEAMWDRLAISHDQFIRTTAPRAPGRRAGADRADLRAQPRRLLRARLRGAVLRRLRGVQAATRRSWTASACCTPRARSSGSRSATGSSACRATRTSCAGCIERAARSSSSRRAGATRSSALLDQGLEDISASRARFGWGVPFPRPTVDGRGADHVRLVRRAAQLLDRDAASRARARRWPASCTSSARTSPASTASSGRRCSRPPGCPLPERVWAHGFVYLGGERFSKSAGVKLDLRRGDRPLRRRRLPLLPAARGALGRRRQLQLGALRGALHLGPRRRARQPRQPLARDAREVPRRRRAGATATGTSLDADGRRRGGEVRRRDGCARPPRRRRDRLGTGQPAQTATSCRPRPGPWPRRGCGTANSTPRSPRWPAASRGWPR